MKNVLALDLAATAGWCVGPADQEPAFGTFDIGGPDSGEAYLTLYRRIDRLVGKYEVNALSYEAPFLMAQAGKTTVRLHGYAAIVDFYAAQARLPIQAGRVQSIRKTFLGALPKKGTAKQAVIDQCRRCGLEVTDHNAADAIALWFWAQKKAWPADDIAIEPQHEMF